MIQLSETAKNEVKRLIGRQEKSGQFLRVGIRGGGCSGLTYDIKFDDKQEEYDRVFEQDGVKLLVDAKSHLYLDGTTIDFASSVMGGGFQFSNPLAKKSCGCGTSFTT